MEHVQDPAASSDPAPSTQQAAPMLLLNTPALWRTQLLTHCCDPDALLVLFQTCKHLLDEVLQLASDVIFTPDLTLKQPQLTVACALLSQFRGQKPCRLVLKQRKTGRARSDTGHPRQTFQDAGQLVQAARHVCQALSTARVTHLMCRGALSQHCSELVAAAAPPLPHLTSLHLRSCDAIGPLPPPAQLPQLQSLSISSEHDDAAVHDDRDAQQAMMQTAGPYLPQLTQLTLRSSRDLYSPQQHLHRLVTTTTTTLRTLTLKLPLGGQLVRLVQQHAPALRHLTVSSLTDLTSDHSDSTWGLAKLSVWYSGTHGEPPPAQALARLPQCLSDMQLELDTPVVTIELSSVQADVASQLAVLPRFIYPALEQVQISPPPRFPQQEQLAAFTAMLPQLPTTVPLACPDLSIVLYMFTWDPALAQALAAAVTAYPQLKFCVRAATLTDALLDVLITHGPKEGYELMAGAVQLTSAQHSGAVWPWRKLQVEGASLHLHALAMLLPDPAGVTRQLLLREEHWYAMEAHAEDQWDETGVEEEEERQGEDTSEPWHVSLSSSSEWHLRVSASMPNGTNASDLVARLQPRLQYLSIQSSPQRKNMTIELCGPAGRRLSASNQMTLEQVAASDQVTLLQGSLQLVEAAGLTADSQVTTVRLKDYTITPELVSQLSHLPEWRAELMLGGDKGRPLQVPAGSCHLFATSIPASYTVWRIHAAVSQEQLLAICQGLAQNRQAGQRPVRVQVGTRVGRYSIAAVAAEVKARGWEGCVRVEEVSVRYRYEGDVAGGLGFDLLLMDGDEQGDGAQ